MSFLQTKLFCFVIYLLLIVSTGALIVSAAVSLNWRYFHDVPIMIYCAYLIDSGFIPYRDFFEMNMPGVYFCYLIAAKIFGWSDLSFRIFDILYLASISFFTYLWLRPIGKIPAISAALLFGLFYLNDSNYLILQREYIEILPLCIILWLMYSCKKLSKNKILLLTGILIGFGISIKPQFILLSLPPVLFFIFENKSLLKVRSQIKFLLTGILIPLSIIVLYLIFTGSLKPFLDIVMNYWGLYSALNREHRILEGSQKISFILKSLFDGLYTPLVPLAIVGILLYNRDNPGSKFGYMLTMLITASVIYLLIAGKFYDYHWIAFNYFALCSAGYITRISGNRTKARNLIQLFTSMLLFVPLIKSNIGYSVHYLKNKDRINITRFAAADEIASYLKENLKDGQKVQPLDWTSGAIHAMLISKAIIATPFIYDFHFYHHIRSPWIENLMKGIPTNSFVQESNFPYIINLRNKFINELSTARPEYIIQFIGNRSWPEGDNTTHEFSELTTFINNNYEVVKEGNDYKIFCIK